MCSSKKLPANSVVEIKAAKLPWWKCANSLSRWLVNWQFHQKAKQKIKIIVVIIIKKRIKQKCSQERVHGWGIREAQKSLSSFFDAGSDEDAVWGLANGVRDWLICKLWIKVSKVTGAALWKGQKRNLDPKILWVCNSIQYGDKHPCTETQCYHLRPTV